MITKYRQDRIERVCLAYVAGMLADFTNPKNKGRNFSWQEWPDMCAEHSVDWLFVHIPRKLGKDELEYGQEYARMLATHYAERAGLLEEHND